MTGLDMAGLDGIHAQCSHHGPSPAAIMAFFGAATAPRHGRIRSQPRPIVVNFAGHCSGHLGDVPPPAG
jgi:hypothetical protein